MKTCTKCKETKPLDRFSFRKERGTYRTYCKDCRNSGEARKYRESRREELAEQYRQYYKENSDRVKDVQKSYRENNPGVGRECSYRRRARAASAPGHRTDEQTKSRWLYHGNKCIYCGSTENLTDEHLIPLSRGGSDWPANIAPSCKSCNCSKNTKTHLEFLKWKENN